jgi:hypothetical protein
MVRNLKCRVIDLKIGFGGKPQSEEVTLYNKGDKDGPGSPRGRKSHTRKSKSR